MFIVYTETPQVRQEHHQPIYNQLFPTLCVISVGISYVRVG
ncbi:MAG: hypothetical protein QNJ41_23640 [Xenococcaceae cyanobacterium MO_188.B32]|nr:hypothetical protein [Xenococcaceae cyanobacterium MO_188.B32]